MRNLITKAKFMKYIITMLVLITGIVTAVPVHAYVSVDNYFRSNGTYVRPHVRSTPNAFRFDNYSYSGGSLYNDSYFRPTKNYSSSWYQPSYVTDPYYYTGKSLYDSGSSGLYNSYLYKPSNSVNSNLDDLLGRRELRSYLRP